MRALTDPAQTGAVTVCLPQDVQAQAHDWPVELFEERVWHVARPVPEPAALERALAVIRSAQRPLVVAGGGVIYSGATDALRAFADATGVPVAETQAGKGSMPYDSPLALGAVGSTGTTAANAVAAEADVVIGIGTRWSDFTTASRTAFQAPGVRFVNVNVTALDTVKHAGTGVLADARETLVALTERLAGWTVDPAYRQRNAGLAAEWDAVVQGAYDLGHGPLPAQSEVIGAVNDVSGPRDVVVCAAGSMPGDLHKLWRTRDPKGYHVEYGFSCMGYEIAGGMGAAMACPDRDVYVMCGDGSYLMMAQELVTCVQEGIKIVVVLVQNHGFASIGELSESLGSQRFGTAYRYRDEQPAPDRRRAARRPGRERREPRRAGAAHLHRRGVPQGAPAGQERDRTGDGARRHRPARPRAEQRLVVGRARVGGRRARHHPAGARDVRRPQVAAAAVPVTPTPTAEDCT